MSRARRISRMFARDEKLIFSPRTKSRSFSLEIDFLRQGKHDMINFRHADRSPTENSFPV
jgi:hypothetical protein